MNPDKNSKLLRIFLGEYDKHNGMPLYEAIVLAAKKHGLAGATVFRGILSYGASSIIHASKLLDLPLDLPIIAEIVDTQEKIDEFVEVVNPIIEEAGCGALITIEAVEVIRYKAKKND